MFPSPPARRAHVLGASWFLLHALVVVVTSLSPCTQPGAAGADHVSLLSPDVFMF